MTFDLPWYVLGFIATGAIVWAAAAGWVAITTCALLYAATWATFYVGCQLWNLHVVEREGRDAWRITPWRAWWRSLWSTPAWRHAWKIARRPRGWKPALGFTYPPATMEAQDG
ncbi:hypothetical protein EOD42_13945 [Rhodovarius crocodyli]|uniref:Uncharacterized protein n=1 Tax=Rhodovarius crocodyli TaxID=1979269 RepID=A0A437MF08_9PROT|nr:hypothetical protein [Rhodovarius crocodyli]RVT96213.1 hypothetical protein EOD42_13945 [Rhodovarius crocodyli]